MKRLLALLLSVCMVCSLLGCSQKDSEVPPQPETPSQPEAPSPALPEGPLYLLTAEYGRLYAVNAKGESCLLKDAYCHAFHRKGDQVLAAFSGGEIYLMDLAANTQELLLTTKNPANELIFLDTGFFFRSDTMTESTCFFYDFASKQQCDLPEYGWNYTAAGGRIAYLTWSDALEVLALFDPKSMKQAFEIPVNNACQLLVLDDTIYYQTDRWSGSEWYRIDLDTQTAVPAEIHLPTDYGSIMTHGDAGFLMSDNYYASEHPGVWLWKDGAVTFTPLPASDHCWNSVSDEADGIALLATMTSFTENEDGPDKYQYYTTMRYTLYDTHTGTFTDLPFVSDTEKLFAGGDFPVIDSSTARKPVTRSLYSLFCLQSQAGGAEPLCSTTHGAWLNIADGGADIALLAEPTAEEQAYLKEKNVDIEMKLYGGDGLVFIGNDACGVTDLTLDQVRSIYRGEITNWAELGGVDADIHVLYRDDQSGSQRLFEKLVWKGEEVPDFKALGFEILDEMSSIVSCCIYDPYAIGYSIMTYLNDVYANEELLAFSLNGVEATPEQVAATRYPLGTQGYVVIRADEPENSPARRLYDWIGCPISDDLLRNNGVTPLHAS